MSRFHSSEKTEKKQAASKKTTAKGRSEGRAKRKKSVASDTTSEAIGSAEHFDFKKEIRDSSPLVLESTWEPDTKGASLQEEPPAVVHRGVDVLAERLLTGFSGGLLVAYGLRRRGARGWALAALGGTFLIKSLMGRNATYKKVQTWRYNRNPNNQSLILEGSILVRLDADAVYEKWKEIDGLPSFLGLDHMVASSTQHGFVWNVIQPGESVLLEGEILADIPGRMIAWQSPEGAPISHEGVVQFAQMEQHHATELKLMLKFNPPFDGWREAVLGADPNQLVTQALLRFKESVESLDARSKRKH